MCIVYCGKEISKEELDAKLARFADFMSGEIIGQKKLIRNLSAGNQQKVGILAAMLRNPQLLILDEPTNDLDIVTLNILEEYLLEFRGTLLIVSHDRHFLDRLVNHLFVFCGDGVVKDFIGNFSEYRAYIKDYEAQKKKEAEPRATAPKQAVNKPEHKPGKLTWKEQKELEALEKELPELEEEKAALEGEMSSGTLAYDELQTKAARIQEIIDLIDEKEMHWLELQEK